VAHLPPQGAAAPLYTTGGKPGNWQMPVANKCPIRAKAK
jgi:hypothetical protein